MRSEVGSADKLNFRRERAAVGTRIAAQPQLSTNRKQLCKDHLHRARQYGVPPQTNGAEVVPSHAGQRQNPTMSNLHLRLTHQEPFR